MPLRLLNSIKCLFWYCFIDMTTLLLSYLTNLGTFPFILLAALDFDFCLVTAADFWELGFRE